MKNKIIVGLLMVSALSFGAGNNNTRDTNNSGQRVFYQTQMMNNLSKKKQTELTKMIEDRREANYKKGLDVRSKQLELEKLLSEDKVNWKSVERVNKQTSDMKAKQRLDGMKFRSDIEDKFGLSIGHKGMKGNCGSIGNGHRNN
ncbi:hypothetical protein [Psychrilyobacter sp.]|uniref:hypothetical protein n=1 Tax=Psychrilyobacter sp. TaxID=2586924 RepID=UPI0030194C80